MNQSVVVVDYGIGNVFSVCNALKQIGAEPQLTRDIPTILQAERVILPGVGAFGRAMDALRGFGLDEALGSYVATGRPFLGICIGMQVLMDSSLEFGAHAGLGFIPGTVERIPSVDKDGNPLRVPHISWSKVKPAAGVLPEQWQPTPLSGDEDYQEFYFVHSYHSRPNDASNLLAIVDHGGNDVTAAITKDNIVGVQFHPERSGLAGLSLLGKFMGGP
ncbi:imidazole glycerol phosphate synthase subunit HisH [Rhizobium laguerreae]|uniref:imidazole glycerol phosphate synthase subunit HisH n=1 Tax=Rhizobium laguerreae TaxID=1076926 RepID=UPI001C910AFA|nr:imidazole glycerol phosphate synthase subunit HisH [Rhizobium laguerreae]MBY3253165.1 imidazole glycerol phosphate synthase subunit HisH [Rhizobium laguerreae]MBY3281380.1 imidazole glycerol phosphate synthase subunit HisH [Rhizobium laguerreae]MBY3294193.1 imidazole glycerol phosphate synthase subunit HisH [Rhizobium laguerreae]